MLDSLAAMLPEGALITDPDIVERYRRDTAANPGGKGLSGRGELHSGEQGLHGLQALGGDEGATGLRQTLTPTLSQKERGQCRSIDHGRFCDRHQACAHADPGGERWHRRDWRYL